MKTARRIVSVIFGVVGIVGMIAAAQPLGAVLRHVFDPRFRMIAPTSGQTFLL